MLGELYRGCADALGCAELYCAAGAARLETSLLGELYFVLSCVGPRDAARDAAFAGELNRASGSQADFRAPGLSGPGLDARAGAPCAVNIAAVNFSAAAEFGRIEWALASSAP